MTYINNEGAEGRVTIHGEPPAEGTTIDLPQEIR